MAIDWDSDTIRPEKMSAEDLLEYLKSIYPVLRREDALAIKENGLKSQLVSAGITKKNARVIYRKLVINMRYTNNILTKGADSPRYNLGGIECGLISKKGVADAHQNKKEYEQVKAKFKTKKSELKGSNVKPDTGKQKLSEVVSKPNAKQKVKKTQSKQKPSPVNTSQTLEVPTIKIKKTSKITLDMLNL